MQVRHASFHRFCLHNLKSSRPEQVSVGYVLHLKPRHVKATPKRKEAHTDPGYRWLSQLGRCPAQVPKQPILYWTAMCPIRNIGKQNRHQHKTSSKEKKNINLMHSVTLFKTTPGMGVWMCRSKCANDDDDATLLLHATIEDDDAKHVLPTTRRYSTPPPPNRPLVVIIGHH